MTIAKKRFSTEGNGVDENHRDAMGTVDMGISEKSGKIAQKVLEIQRKVSSSMPLPGTLHAYLSSQRTSLKLRFPVNTEG